MLEITVETIDSSRRRRKGFQSPQSVAFAFSLADGMVEVLQYASHMSTD